MAKRATLENLDAVIAEVLEEYGEQTVKATHEVVKKVAKAGANEINSAAAGAVGGSKYKRSWTSTSDNGRFTAHAVIHSEIPGLPHLLEYGHAGRNGGRGAAAHVHIAPVVDKLNEQFIRMIEVTI